MFYVSVLIGVSVSAVFVVILTVLLVVYLRRRRLRWRKRSIACARYDNLFTTLRRPSPVQLISTRRQHSAPASYQTNYSTFDIVTEYQQETSSGRPSMDSGPSRRRSGEPGEKLTKFHSVDNSGVMSKNGATGTKKTIKKSMSNPVIASKYEAEPELCPNISFTLKYDSKSRQLRMKLLSISDLSSKCYGCDVSAVVYLFPRNVDGVHSRTVSGAREIQLNETFIFDDLTQAEVEKSTMRFLMQYRKKVRSSKDNFLGEVNMKCCDFDWSTNETLNFTALPLGSKQKSVSRNVT